MANKNQDVKGNGHINVTNVNSQNSQCIFLTYTLHGIADLEHAKTICNKIMDLVDVEVKFNVEQTDWRGDDEKTVLKVKIKDCRNEKKAHVYKASIDEFIKKIGGQTTLDEVLGEGHQE